MKTAQADGDGASARPLPDAETALELLETMALIRRFEEEAGRQYQRAKAGGFLHLAIGEEATIVGTTSAMRPERLPDRDLPHPRPRDRPRHRSRST